MRSDGFTIIEVLIATLLLALLIGSLIIINIRLGQANARAEVQSVEAATAEAAVTQYRDQLPSIGRNISGSAENVLSSDSLTNSQKALLKVLIYNIARKDTSTIVVTVKRNDITDPNPLILQMD